jgi:hypothetical protein
MTMISRRRALVGAGAATFAAAAFAPARADTPGGAFARLHGTGRTDLPPEALRQRSIDSPAPAAADPGRWRAAPPLPLPRGETGGAAAWADRLHLLGGYGRGRVSNAYHQVFVAADNRWIAAAPLPRAGNHVGVAAADGRLYAVGGHTEQNRRPYADCFAYDIAADRWRRIAPLPRARGAISVVARGGLIHAIGGAVGNDFRTKRSVAWHTVYDPGADRWRDRAPLPVGRDHMGAVAIGDAIHVVAGRVDSAAHNVGSHDVYLVARDRWTTRAALPTPRSGHGAVLYRGRIFVMGGERFLSRTRGPDGRWHLDGRVFGQNEAYDPKTDRWVHHAPMPTPRHGLGAAMVGDAIHVVGGGPVAGGGVQSAVHEAFTLG